MRNALLLTTQPGWALATLAELRARGIKERIDFYHRDSTLLAPADPALIDRPLLTPEDVCGVVGVARAMPHYDATERFRRLITPDGVREQVLSWLEYQRAPREPTLQRRYSVEAEVWGQTAVHRHALADLVRQAMRDAFPTWRETSAGGVRLICKADPEIALLGVQLYSTLGEAAQTRRVGQAGGHWVRHGRLREHLACGLLTLAGVQPGDTVLDPFMGTGTILRAAGRDFGARALAGAEVDAAAYRLARRALAGTQARLVAGSFGQLDVAALPPFVKLVSNLPFGVQFAPVPTRGLLRFLRALLPRLAGVALLMGREQARGVAPAIGLRAKHVLVLGQPAAIVYGVP